MAIGTLLGSLGAGLLAGGAGALGRHLSRPNIPQTHVDLPSATIRQLSGGNELMDEIMRRWRGQGVGIAPQFYERATSPVVRERMRRYRQFERPAMEEGFASRGISYSPMTADIMSRRRGDLESEIQRYLGETALSAEQLKRQEMQNALQMHQGLLGVEAGMQARRAAMQAGLGQQEAARQQAMTMDWATPIQQGLMTGANVYGALTAPDITSLLNRGRTSQAPASAVPGISTPQRGIWDDMLARTYTKPRPYNTLMMRNQYGK